MPWSIRNLRSSLSPTPNMFKQHSKQHSKRSSKRSRSSTRPRFDAGSRGGVLPMIRFSSEPVRSTLRRARLDAAAESTGEVGEDVQKRVSSLGAGVPLPRSERTFFEPRLGTDLSAVRVHTGARAEAAAESVSARAFALGSDIAFGAGEFRPGSAEGRRLIAHELTHTLQQRTVSPRVQRKPCKNLDAAKKLKEAAKKKLSSGESVKVFQLDKEKTYTDVAKRFRADNSVRSNKELADKLVDLNGGKSGLKAKQCVVVIKGWQSPAYLKHRARVDCTIRMAGLIAASVAAAVAAGLRPLLPTDFAKETVVKSDKGYESVVKRAKGKDSSLFTGRAAEYAKTVEAINKGVLGKSIKVGDCVLLIKGWQDPNIGSLPGKPNPTKPLDASTVHLIATIFGEQTQSGSSEDEQRKYIFFTIRRRIGSASFKSKLKDVVIASQFHAIGGSNYKSAKAQLESGTITNPVVQSTRDTVLNHWTTPLPADSGPFYFHWRAGSTSDGCYKAAKKKDLAAEKRCAHKWAAKKGWAGSVDATAGWLKRIRSSGGTPLLSMYIYPGG
ncbi:MAG: DUF4157 domain-containing protein [Acidobacteriota bacterium]